MKREPTCKPTPRVVLNTIDIYGLMDEPQLGSFEDKIEAFGDLEVVIGSHCLKQEGHGPSIFGADVWT